MGVVLLTLFALFAGGRASATPAPPSDGVRAEFRKVIMGVEARLVVHAPDDRTAQRAAQAAFVRLDALDAVLSDWRADSELSDVCARAGDGPVPVGDDLFDALARAVDLARFTGRAFDPTIGALVRLWRDARRDGVRPSDEAWDDAASATGLQLLKLDRVARTVDLRVPGARLDLGGIGKGFAADAALAVLREHGCPASLVDLGGDLVVGAAPPGRDGWQIEAGCGEGGLPPRRLLLVDRAVATSGDTEQSLDWDGTRVTHLIDPRTARPLPVGACATVVAPDGATADALASAARVLGPRAARALFADLPDVELVAELAGQQALFDGSSLEGWVTEGGRYDGAARWSVEDGVITGRTGEHGEGGLLYTSSAYTSFVFECEVSLDRPFDSGVFVRMAQEGKGAQITLDVRPDGEVGAVYADGFLRHQTEAKAWWRVGWNHVEVECTGFDMRLRAWLNGRLMTDFSMPQGEPGYAPRGLIGLQVHDSGGAAGRAVRFRDVRVRKLPVFPEVGGGLGAFDAHATRTPTTHTWATDGWTPLVSAGSSPAEILARFEAVDSDGVHAPLDYVVDEHGVLRIPASQPAGYLRTRDDHRDFALRLDWRAARMANSGLFLRGDRQGGDPAFSGCEIQIIDDAHWGEVTGTPLLPWQHAGSLYAVVANPLPELLAPVGAWNTYEVLMQGTRLAVALNGETLYDTRTDALDAAPPFAERAPTGFVGLQRYASPWVEDAFALDVREMWIDDR